MTLRTPLRCLISLFYIKPQLTYGAILVNISCLISLFYIKPQRVESDVMV